MSKVEFFKAEDFEGCYEGLGTFIHVANKKLSEKGVRVYSPLNKSAWYEEKTPYSYGPRHFHALLIAAEPIKKEPVVFDTVIDEVIYCGGEIADQFRGKRVKVTVEEVG